MPNLPPTRISGTCEQSLSKVPRAAANLTSIWVSVRPRPLLRSSAALVRREWSLLRGAGMQFVCHALEGDLRHLASSSSTPARSRSRRHDPHLSCLPVYRSRAQLSFSARPTGATMLQATGRRRAGHLFTACPSRLRDAFLDSVSRTARDGHVSLPWHGSDGRQSHDFVPVQLGTQNAPLVSPEPGEPLPLLVPHGATVGAADTADWFAAGDL